jgi:DNA primase
MSDFLAEAFIAHYGIKNLLNDLDIKGVKNSGIGEVIMRCPFHEDKMASFAMSLKNGLWKCFGCGLEGNLIKFIMLAYHLNYVQANDFLHQRAGLSDDVNIDDLIFLREIENIIGDKTEKEETENIKVNFTPEIIASMYEGQDPYNYLQERGLDDDTINYFECGYTKHWKCFRNKKTFYEERITWPGHDKDGNIIGFIGRTPVGDEPKYRYTIGYKKADNLFNFHRAKSYAKDGIILVEGSFDAMKIHSFGYPNVCAILGAKLSANQTKILFNMTNKVYLMFDNDNAGRKANENALQTLQENLDIYYIPLGNLKDPGEIQNKQTFDKLFYNARSWFAYNM